MEANTEPKPTFEETENVEKNIQDVDNSIFYEEAETSRVLRKVDYRLLPMLTVLYLLSFLDRGNSKLLSYSLQLF
jgi:hypothetical protein